MAIIKQPEPNIIQQQIKDLLAEDIGTGDLTATLIHKNSCSTATITCNEAMVLCGNPWVDAIFKHLDPDINIAWSFQDGDNITADTLLCTLHGRARALLTGERTALNMLQTLSATATLARRYAEAISGTKAKILDTRKTIPGLRMAQKYAVRCGGCHNHRTGLFDAILIKENHIQAAGSIRAALIAVKQQAPDIDIDIEIEVESIAQLHQALSAGATHILLDNFDLKMLQQAVQDTNGHAQLEASGNINLQNVRKVALTGVDTISIGALTKHVQAIDLSMRITSGKL